MEEPIDNGRPFVVGDLWHPAAFAKSLDEHELFFEQINTTLKPLSLLEQEETDNAAHFEFKLDLLDSPEPNIPPEVDLTVSVETSSIQIEASELPGRSIWNYDDLIAQAEQPKLCTWEAFLGQENCNVAGPAFHSEAGPLAFDSAISSINSSPELGVLPRDYTLRSLSNLILGRSSSLFQWDQAKAEFVPTLDRVTISGCSTTSSGSIVHLLLSMGNAIAKLRTFVGIQPRSTPPAAAAAVRSCISVMLDAIDESISAELCHIHSLLQLQRLVEQPRKVLALMDAVVEQARNTGDEEDIVSRIRGCLRQELLIDFHLRQVVETLIAQLSVPWFEQIARAIGFVDPGRALLIERNDSDSRILAQAMPSFVSEKDAMLIQNTSENVCLLRELSPEHPLLTERGQTVGSQSMFACFTNPDTSNEQAINFAAQDLSHLCSTDAAQRSHSDEPKNSKYYPDHSHENDDNFFDPETLIPMIIKPPITNHIELRKQVVAICQIDRYQEQDSAVLDTVHVPAQLDRVRPLMLAHSKSVNAILLRQLFLKYRLFEHLEAQRQFHLFGNGSYVTRLCTALFSTDVQSAERRRGKMPTAETMGLRLGTTHEERWPPASSELQLTLMGILGDTYAVNHAHSFNAKLEASELPGSLSFAIRQLPEKDIDRVLDPNSLYALDFLRLQYNAIPPLDAVFTASALENYDQIFRFLLRLLRLLHITGTLPSKAQAPTDRSTSKISRHFFIQARNFVTVLASHMLDVGTNVPWQDFVSQVAKVQHRVASLEDQQTLPTATATTIQDLRQLHDTCLERIRSRLFLKRRQERIRVALEDVLSVILTGCLSTQSVSDTQPVDLSILRSGMKKFHTLLNDVTNKPLKEDVVAINDEAETATLLLVKLNWNGFYDDSG